MDLLFTGHTLGTLERAFNKGKHLGICRWYIFFDGMVSDWSWFSSVSGLKCKCLSSLSGFSFLGCFHLLNVVMRERMSVYLYKDYIHGIIFYLLDYICGYRIEFLISSVGRKQCDHNICIVTWTHMLVSPKWSNRMSDGTNRCLVGGTLLPPFCVLLLMRFLFEKFMWYFVFISFMIFKFGYNSWSYILQCTYSFRSVRHACNFAFLVNIKIGTILGISFSKLWLINMATYGIPRKD